jgi:hypothetical protein
MLKAAPSSCLKKVLRDKQSGWGINISQFCVAQFLRLKDL